MKSLLSLALLVSLSSFASVPLEEVDCYSDMSDGQCEMSESENSFKAHCTIDVVLTLKSGEKIPAVYEGKSTVKKNSYALFMNDLVKERTVQMANGELYQNIKPFFTMKSCN